MSLSNVNIDAINTLPILSVAGFFKYTFEIPENARVQFLWSQYISLTDATAGVRAHVLAVRDENAALILQLVFFRTQTASGSLFVTWAQGLTIIPATVLGLITTLPTDGLFMRNGWSINFFLFGVIGPGDSFSGNFQTRGLHNSAAQN